MQPLYIEPSDEITTVIGRMKEASDTAVALVVPKGAILLQSVVNLKLARRAAAEAGKELTVITTDKIGQNLCKQIGIATFTRLSDKNVPESDGEESEENDSHVINGVKVHRYYEESDKAEEPETEEDDATVAPIVPKEIMKEAPAKKMEAAPEESPIVVRSITTSDPGVAAETVTTVAPIAAEVAVPEPAQEKEPEAAEKKPTHKVVITTAETPSPKTPAKMKKVRRHHPAALAAYLLIVLLLIGGAAGAYLLPKTVVTITVKPTSWTAPSTLEVKAGAVIPLQTLTGETTDTVSFKATGTKDIGNKATGTAQLYNSLGSPSSLPAGAVISAGGQNFTTDTAATIPAATASIQPDGTPVATPGTATVNVTAQDTGTASNLGGVSGSVTSPATKSYARIVSTTGGSSQTVNVITAADIAGAQKAVSDQLKTDTLAKLTDQMKAADYIFDDTKDAFSVTGFTPSVAAGTQADSATATAKGSLARMVVDKAGVTAAAQSLAKVAETAPGSTLFIDSTDIVSSAFDTTAGAATIVTATHGRTSPAIDATSLKNSLAGKKLDNGVSLVKDASKGNDYVVKQTPSWWPLHNFPLSKRLLTVTVTYE